MFLGSTVGWLPFPRAHGPQGQIKVSLGHPQVGRLAECRHLDADAELFEYLPTERVRRRLAGFDMAAGKVPHRRVVPALRGAKAQEHFPGISKEGGHDDVLHQRKVGPASDKGQKSESADLRDRCRAPDPRSPCGVSR